MAWGARSGLKLAMIFLLLLLTFRLNGLGSPFGIETFERIEIDWHILSAKWPGEPVRD